MTNALLDPTAEFDTIEAPAPEAMPLTGTGRPRTASTPGRKPGQKNGTGRTTRRADAPPRRAASASTPKRPAVDYRPGVKGLLQIGAMIPAAISRVVRNPKTKAACAADVVAVHMHAANIAEAAHQTALNEPRWAAVLDKLLTIGPYGLMIAAVFEFGAQVAANHEVAPVGFMGARSRDELLQAAGAGGPAEPSAG